MASLSDLIKKSLVSQSSVAERKTIEAKPSKPPTERKTTAVAKTIPVSPVTPLDAKSQSSAKSVTQIALNRPHSVIKRRHNNTQK